MTIARQFTPLSIYFLGHIGVGIEYLDSRLIAVPLLQYRAEVSSYSDNTWYCNYPGNVTSLVEQKQWQLLDSLHTFTSNFKATQVLELYIGTVEAFPIPYSSIDLRLPASEIMPCIATTWEI